MVYRLISFYLCFGDRGDCTVSDPVKDLLHIVCFIARGGILPDFTSPYKTLFVGTTVFT
jgi:hypothetical protein